MVGGFVVMSSHYWGWGATVEEAKAQHRREGGKLNDRYMILELNPEVTFLRITQMGAIEYNYGDNEDVEPVLRERKFIRGREMKED